MLLDRRKPLLLTRALEKFPFPASVLQRKGDPASQEEQEALWRGPALAQEWGRTAARLTAFYLANKELFRETVHCCQWCWGCLCRCASVSSRCVSLRGEYRQLLIHFFWRLLIWGVNLTKCICSSLGSHKHLLKKLLPCSDAFPLLSCPSAIHLSLWHELIRRMHWVHGHINPPGIELHITQLFKLLRDFPSVVLLYGLYGVKGALLLKGLKDLGPVCLRSLKIPWRFL